MLCKLLYIIVDALEEILQAPESNNLDHTLHSRV
jgi:hypothetical protein